MRQKKEANLELIRLIAMIFVMAIHTQKKPFPTGTLPESILSSIIFICNGWFYMLSGQLNLSKHFENEYDTLRFYVKRFITIIIPYVLISMIITLINYINTNDSFSFIYWLKWSFADIMNTNSSTHMWFMYPLIGFILSTPLLAKGLQKMSNNELHIVFAIGVIWNVFQVYICMDNNINFSYSGWVFSGWALAYFCGYYVYRVINDNNSKYLILAGIIGFCVTLLAKWKIPDKFFNIYDLSIFYILYTMATYYLMSKKVKIKNRNVSSIVNFFARYSFLMYLVHFFINQNIIKKYLQIKSDSLSFIVSVFGTFVISFCVAWLLDTLIFYPLTKFLKSKLLKI